MSILADRSGDVFEADSTAACGPTLRSYFEAFSPVPSWDDIPRWPPDVFAFANLILDHTEAYRFAVSPPDGGKWPPVPGWNEMVGQAGDQWREAAADPLLALPGLVASHWELITHRLDAALADLRRGEARETWEALLTLHAMADEACKGLNGGSPTAGHVFEKQAWDLLDRCGSLSRIDPSRIRIVPKTHLSARGITIRSFSRYVALFYESVDVHWRRIEMADEMWHRPYNILLVPWPLVVRADDFRPVPGPLENMDPAAFGFFEFSPKAHLDLERLASLLERATASAGDVDAVVMPEASVDVAEIAGVEALMESAGVTHLVAGVRERAGEKSLGQNHVHLAVHGRAGWECYEQAKHNRWCLDGSQISQYRLSAVLDPKLRWWEAIDLPVRALEILDTGGATTATLICEDLARMDEVSDLLRRVGPSLVIALLLDGPQLANRWPCRYASVLSDEPGSAVLTLTSLGMAIRSCPRGKTRSRAVALWSDPATGLRQIELARGADGILVATKVDKRTVWTADGRRHEANTPAVTLSSVHQLRPHRRSTA